MSNILAILASEPGKGKTYGCMGFEEPVRILDLENRDKRTHERFFSDRLIEVIELKHFKDYKEDYLSSYKALETEVTNLLTGNGDTPATFIIDGISDIRNSYAIAEWCRRWEAGEYGKATKRKQPMNSGDWKQVNDIVRDLLDPVVNFARKERINLVFTSQFTDDYVNDQKVGRTPAYKDWVGYNLDTLIELYGTKGGEYTAVCTKSIAGSWTENITGRSLYQVLLEKGV